MNLSLLSMIRSIHVSVNREIRNKALNCACPNFDCMSFMTLHSVPKCSACVHYRDTTIRGFPQSLCSMYKQTQLLKANKSKYFHRILYYKALLVEGRYEGLDLAFFLELVIMARRKSRGNLSFSARCRR